MERPWTCVVFSCSNATWNRVLEEALIALRNRKLTSSITNETQILAATDPGTNIGSGAATLNALYVVTEYLSAKRNYTVVTSDVLQDANVLILHHGREYCYDIGGKGLIAIPRIGSPNDNLIFDLQTNLEHLVNLMSVLKNKNPNCGIWVCSTDSSFLHCDVDVSFGQNISKDCTIFCVNSDKRYASQHGVVVSDNSGAVQNISYCADEEYLGAIAKDDQVQVVSGIVYFPVSVAEKLLLFHTIAPLSCCTYVGVDAGSEPLKMSLFFDILVAMIRSITEEDYLSGQYGNKYNVKAGLNYQGENILHAARKVIWSHLSNFTLKVVVLNNLKHCYWDERLPAENHIENIISFGKMGCLQSIVKSKECSLQPRTVIINSLLDCEKISLGQNSLICNSKIECGEIAIGSNCFLSSVNIELPKSMPLLILDNICALGFERNGDIREKITVVFGTKDHIHNEVDVSVDKFCGLPWSDFLRITKMKCEDIWPEGPKSLWCARIFPSTVNVYFYLQIFLGHYDELLNLNWSNVSRYSLQQLVNGVDIEKEVLWRKEISCDVICSQIAESIENNIDRPFLHFFQLAFCGGWHLKILDALDKTAEKVFNRQFELCRTLSCIADLLGTMAGTMGRVRSGPGNNKAWIPAFEYLRQDDPGKAIETLKQVREKWLSLNLIIRAARHYESALQIFVQNVVKSVKTFVILGSGIMPEIGQSVTVECPARVDVQGGWSDTPPICYEQGGSVVNIALLLDGKKPVGAMVTRSVARTISFRMKTLDFSVELEIKSLSELSDFNQVYANCALLKAAVICAELVDITLDMTLEEQLEKYGSGFEISSWSLLPQGSGLGTSSILAGGIIAALWTASGRTYTKSSVLHAVLYLEQLLTTGGGWQDQVGGIMGGVNRGYSLPGTPLEIKVDKIPIGQTFLSVLNKQLFLIYTGKVRLAKNLLQNVIRNWYAREENVVNCFKELVANSYVMAEAFRNEDLRAIGEQMNRYWEQKKVLASGCEPLGVHELMKHLQSCTYGQLLAGAGGGGFMCILTRQPCTVQDIQDKIMQLPSTENITVHSVDVDMTGLTVSVDGVYLNLR